MKAIDKMTDNPPQEGLSGRKIIYDEDGKPYVGLRKAIQDLLIQSSL
jgi:hypothetical protein